MKYYALLALLHLANAQNCNCPSNYHQEGDSNSCYMDVDYLPCNASEMPICKCPEGFLASITGPIATIRHECVNLATDQRQPCDNSNLISKFVAYYLKDRSNWDLATQKTGSCFCPQPLLPTESSNGKVYCAHAGLPFRRIPCGFQEAPPKCECKDSKLRQGSMEQASVKCTRGSCKNEKDRVDYYMSVKEVCKNCNIAGN